ncbi:hypothetical protein ACF0H5_004307 [Mactra antiquata]
MISFFGSRYGVHFGPRTIFDDEDSFSKPSPIKSRPVIQVQPIPRVKTPPSPPPLEKYEVKKDPVPPQVDYHQLSPKDVNHTLVDGLVADYLHYARYGHVIPVYEGTSSSTCPCCTDRNRQNVRSLLGFPKDVRESQKPTKYDHKSSIRHSKHDEELNSDTMMYPNSMYAHMQRQKAQKEPTAEEKRLQKIAEQLHKGAWMNYQPLPYATNYLNPEFNRPVELNHTLYDTDARGAQSFMRYRVLEADSNYDSAMNKLSNYGGYR